MSQAMQLESPDAPPAPERFFNRELSWLDFNTRVLEEAANPQHPLLERLRFVAISGSNLDEFYSVRVAGLAGQEREGIQTLSPDGLSPTQQLSAIHDRAMALLEAQQAAWRTLRGLLRDAGVTALDATSWHGPTSPGWRTTSTSASSPCSPRWRSTRLIPSPSSATSRCAWC
jgi:polyphosphate kinase